MSVLNGTSRRRRGRKPARSEVSIFLAPLVQYWAAIWRHAHYVIGGGVALYALSGITYVDANQAGIVLRLGAVTRVAGKPIVHPPGLLFALPRPFDSVLIIDVDRVSTITIDELSGPVLLNLANDAMRTTEPISLDPEQYGYLLTGDRNILHAQVIVRFKVRDPVDFALLTNDPSAFLRLAVLESTLRIAGETRLDDLLGGRRDLFSRAVSMEAQRRLDHIGVGLEIVSVEYEGLSPPASVTADFEAVQSAFIEAETKVRGARAYAATIVPNAKATAERSIATAAAAKDTLLAGARADHASFAALLKTYSDNPELVRHRLYRAGVEQALSSVAQLNFVPAPATDGYRGTRFSITPRRNEVPEVLLHETEQLPTVASSAEVSNDQVIVPPPDAAP